jgi:hypothetical protein
MELAPEHVRALAGARAAARATRKWAEADRLRAEIEASGWKVVDQGTDFTLSPAHSPNEVVDGRVRYGSSDSVPSRLDDPPTRTATVVVIGSADADMTRRAIGAVRASAPADTQVVAVGETVDPLAADGVEPVWTRPMFGVAASVNAGIRSSQGATVILVSAGIEATGDLVTPLVQALDDPNVAVAGGFGRSGPDLRRLEPRPAGEVDVVERAVQAFRRADFVDRGPVDERLRLPDSVGTWWSLVLRDEGPHRPPRRAIAIELPVVRHAATTHESPPDARLAKRDFYRILDRFGGRADLLAVTPASRAGDS